MSKAGNSEQIDTDILQCKVDILRARDIIPLHDDTTQKNPATQNNTRETTQSADAAEISTHKDTSSIPIALRKESLGLPQVETQPAKETAPLPRPVVSVNKKEEAETLQEKRGIPRFDLAEEIMAEQRKITAIRRKAPGQRTEAGRSEPQAQLVDHTTEQPTPVLSEQEKIITEIVARDIKRLCRGN